MTEQVVSTTYSEKPPTLAPNKPVRKPTPPDKVGIRSPAGFRNRNIPDGFLLRYQLLAACNLTEGELRSMERAGEITADQRNSRNYALYSKDWVDKIRSLKVRSKRWARKADKRERMSPAIKKKKMAYAEEIGKKAITLLESGARPVDLVLKLGVHPSVAYTLMKDYGALTGGLWIPGDAMALINTLPLDGVFPVTNAKEFMDILITAANELRCATEDCNKRRSRYCKVCQEALKGKISQGVSSSDNSNAESSREHSHTPTKTDDGHQSQAPCPDTHHV